ncbi:hypothetical protein OHA25_19200 [Nonomuraea sp. NBC_00507]
MYAAAEHTDPFGTKVRISRNTLDRWAPWFSTTPQNWLRYTFREWAHQSASKTRLRKKQVVLGAAVHLPLDRFDDAVDVAFDGAGAVGQGEAGGDSVLVTMQAGDERVQLRGVVSEDCGHAGVEVSATALRHHLGEVTDMSA